MGCFSLPCLRWSSKRSPLTTTSSEKASYTPRPHHTSTISTSSAFSDVEKPLLSKSLFSRDSKRISALPSTVTTIRPHVNPAFSAYSTPANYTDSAEGLRQRGIPVKRNTSSTDDTALSASSGNAWGDSPSSTRVTDSPTDVLFGPLSSKAKEEGAVHHDDEDDEAELEKERARKVEEARQQVDAVELEQMDFMQMM